MAAQDNSSSSAMWKAILAAVVLMAVIVPFSMKGKGGAPIAAENDETAGRIQPVARVELLRVAAATGPRSGEQIYNAVCTACHGTGAAGAPKRGDKTAWAPRMGQGIAGLVKSAAVGKGAMPPKGGAADLSDAELTAVVEYLVK